MSETYIVPIVSRNLTKNDAIVQIAELLDHLNTVSEDLFSKINERLDKNKSKLKDVTKRVEVVQTKINNLKSVKKATQVFSSSKYPANEVNRDYTSLFPCKTVLEIKRHKVKQKNYLPVFDPINKLSSYQNKKQSKNNNKCEGLGNMPADIDFVNDLLLYNSGKNLYNKFEMMDVLKGPQNIKHDNTVDISDIGVAPYSIREGSVVNKSNVKSFFYSPKIGDVPELNVPLDLPDLPGIADDLRYDGDSGAASTIAPSANTLLELPPIEKLQINKVVTTVTEVDTATDIIPPAPLPVVVTSQLITPPSPPPPPPPPPPLVQEEEKKEIKIQEKVIPSPPQVQQPEKKDFAGMDMRASLMEAIRNAGGSKKAKLKTINEDAAPTSTTKAPSGDLMADLHAKLSMRRKGISGSKKAENEGGGSGLLDGNTALGKISAMIPPPSKNDVTDSNNTEDEDWDE
ncbi:unnamed protein product [Brassicogethes aeneus]|uniref:WASH1 WAHD domain-containing protein n=1 Tax=Brassicogethes aeneus TaxID=1431903 RepID=A0A9P0BDQ2_BRAAE|nr:unnamed protein product [Brassicogethes aeneus]